MNAVYCSRSRLRSAFTLIELLVVVAIIALLISVLLPSLQSAKKKARAVKCAAMLRHVGTSAAVYLAENDAVYPPSYLYASGPNGQVDMLDQPPGRPYGYVHWSWFLYSTGEVDDKAFQCPEFEDGGLPRTNPGPEPSDWEQPDQVDSRGNSNVNTLEDKQARRIAYSANAAIMPRNKFSQVLSGGPRINKLVREGEINTQRPVVLAAELNNSWVTSSVRVGSGFESKSHRPINPFYHVGSGSNEYQAPVRTPGFMYGPVEDRVTFGLKPYAQVKDVVGVIDGTIGPETNAIGRHHPGGDQLGGTANFVYTDGHVELKTVLQTMKNREWGEAYYSITGRNEVIGID